MATVVPVNVTTAQAYQDIFEKAFDLPTNAALTASINAASSAASTADSKAVAAQSTADGAASAAATADGKAVSAQADATNAKSETDRLKDIKPAAEGVSLSDITALALAGKIAVGSKANTSEYYSGTGYGGNSYHLRDAVTSGARPTANLGSCIHIGNDGLYWEATFDNSLNVYKFGVKKSGDSTAAYQDLIAYGESTGIRALKHGVGSHYCGNLQSDLSGWVFEGRYSGRPTDGGSRIIFNGASGDWFTMGADDSLPYDQNLYDGPQGLRLKNINLVNASANRTTPLNCDNTKFYHAGSAAIRDWRGGDIQLEGSVLIEGFEWSIWGVNSDINNLGNLLQAFCKYGVYVGPRSDQAVISRLYAYYCDSVAVVDGATHTVFDNPVVVNCGSTSDNQIVIKQGSINVIIVNPWLENATGTVDGKPFIGIGLEAGYNSTSPVDAVRIINPTVSVVGAGGFGPKYLIEIGKADAVSVTNLSSPLGQSLNTNLTKICLFAAGFAHASSEFLFMGDRDFSTKLFDNQGTGAPKVQYSIASNGFMFGSSTGRLFINDVDAAAGADSMILSQENLAGRLKVAMPNYTGGQVDRLDQRRSIKDDAAMPVTGTYEIGDYVRNINRSVLGTSPNKYVINGWSRITTGSAHVLNTDWVQDRSLTGQ